LNEFTRHYTHEQHKKTRVFKGLTHFYSEGVHEFVRFELLFNFNDLHSNSFTL